MNFEKISLFLQTVCCFSQITTKSNAQWKLLLEEKVNTAQLAFDSELVWKKKGVAPAIKFYRQKHYVSILDKSGQSFSNNKF
jgi:hypothetical protein